MKTLVLVYVLALSQVALGASLDDVNQAYTGLESLTNSTLKALEAAATNRSNRFLYALAVERLHAKLELQNLVYNFTTGLERLQASVADYPSINVSECFEPAPDPQQYSDGVFDVLEDCLYDNRYEMGVNIINAHLSGIERTARGYLQCVRNEIEECGGGEECGDKVVARIEELTEEVPRNLQLLGVAMLNSLDGLPIRCRERASIDYNGVVEDVLSFVRACVEVVVNNEVGPVCK